MLLGGNMALSDYEAHMMRCTRCSNCKFVPTTKLHESFPDICPSISKYNFHAFSGSGKLIAALSFLFEKTEHSPELLDILYKCTLCGGCDVSCKKDHDLEVLEILLEFRAKCVKDGQVHPVLDKVIKGLEKENNMMQQTKKNRGKWAAGLPVKDLKKEQVDVVFHAGCRLSFDEKMWKIPRTAVELINGAGISVGGAGANELCCGGRAYEMGYRDEMENMARKNKTIFEKSGAKILVTSCAHCYQAFKVLYHKIGQELNIEVLHVVEYLNRLTAEGKIKLKKKVPITVSYHDPCHLGRLGEPWKPWNGVEKKELQQFITYDPPKEFRRGTNGVYDASRELLNRINGLNLVEMRRIEESAWCCGAGGGVKEAYPDFALWTAGRRLEELNAVGVNSLVTACPWCINNFKESAEADGKTIEVLDVVELVKLAAA